MSVRNLAEASGVDRSRIAKAEADDASVTDLTYSRIIKALDDFEHKTESGASEAAASAATPAPRAPVVFKITGVYGVAEVVVEGPVENLPELEAAVERLLLRAQGKGDPQ